MFGRMRSLRFALQGFGHLLRTERSAWWHLVATLIALVLGLVLRLSMEEWRWILLAAALIWAGEAFNTAFERLGDAVSLDHHPQIGWAKDVAAAGVMICVVAALLIALSVFVSPILQLVS
jgi:diacylglycerol kinase (ATP)